MKSLSFFNKNYKAQTNNTGAKELEAQANQQKEVIKESGIEKL